MGKSRRDQVRSASPGKAGRTSTAQIKALDFVVTVTNTNAHLAGALGVPLWILFTPKWGAWWILDSFQTPWYPSATVYANSEGWNHVTERVDHDLKLLAKRSAV